LYRHPAPAQRQHYQRSHQHHQPLRGRGNRVYRTGFRDLDIEAVADEELVEAQPRYIDRNAFKHLIEEIDAEEASGIEPDDLELVADIECRGKGEISDDIKRPGEIGITVYDAEKIVPDTRDCAEKFIFESSYSNDAVVAWM